MRKVGKKKETWSIMDKYWQNVTMATKSFGNSVPGNDTIKQ